MFVCVCVCGLCVALCGFVCVCGGVDLCVWCLYVWVGVCVCM